ncbi:MAG: efflux RND transporter periplasmic adaptor subunit [Pseudomonadota bacterium]|nr:efflux RND transporter periplasmic adaptor subunit [Pseudomonadota bacterium]
MALVLALVVALTGCGDADKTASQGKPGGRAGNGGPKTVGYVVAKQTSAPVVTELAGRASAYRQSEVRPQVSGVIRRRLFTEGALVKSGQPLYEIDPSLYRAATAVAEANLQNAQASAEAARTQAERYKPLAEIEAVSQQEYTNAAAAAKQAAAQVAQFQAQLQTARINLKFTTVPAPISGRIGRSLFTQGALVSANQADPLARINQLDPIFVDIQQPSAALLRLRRSLSQDGVVPASAAVHLILQDGSEYGEVGAVEFSEVLVDQTTGTVTVRARFPNHDSVLLPGMFVRARFAQAIDQNVILVPQSAVTRDPKGAASVFIVAAGDKAESRTITAERTQGPDWVVTEGLQPGDRIIVQGTAKLRPGQLLKPVPADTPQRVAPPGASAPSGASGASGAAGGGRAASAAEVASKS